MARRLAIVRSTNEHGRPTSATSRQKQIRRQMDTVAHGNGEPKPLFHIWNVSAPFDHLAGGAD